MRKIPLLPGLLLLPGVCFLNSCASYVENSGAGSFAATPHVLLFVQTSPTVQNGDPSVPAATYGYSIAADGELTRLPGYPNSSSFYGVISGKYLFTGDPDRMHLDTYLIGADGSFTKVQSIVDQATVQCGSQCSVGPDTTDRTGSSLYVVANSYNSGDRLANPETYSIDKSTGALTYVGQGGTSWSIFKGGCELTDFSGDDSFAYGACGNAYGPPWIAAAGRTPDGSLGTGFYPSVNGPAAPPGIIYSEEAAGTDMENHLAAVLNSWTTNMDPISGTPSLLVSYTINPDGSLTTTNAPADIPAVPTISGGWSLSPSGTLFAVGVPGGIQMFNFNGAAPMTTSGAMIPTDTPAKMQWDGENHLFVLSTTQKLYVFTATGTSVVQTPGSPYSIPNAAVLYVASI